MTRKRAAARHDESQPPKDQEWPPSGAALIDALLAVHHPIRRRLYEVLTVEGPASVGQLAARLDVAVGSVSHHLKPLHKAGFIEPAPDLARDSRESWWRGVVRRLAWDVDDYEPSSFAHRVAQTAEWINYRHLERATTDWMRTRGDLPPQWRHGQVSDSYVAATPEQMQQLADRLDQVLTGWTLEVRADAENAPNIERRAVRVISRVFPSAPGADELP